MPTSRAEIPFRGARLKVERARQHISDLYALFQAFQAVGSYIIHVENDPDTGDSLLKLEIGQSVPEEFLLVAGDAIHNLQTALDFVMNEIELAHTGRMTRHTKFPVYDTRDELKAAVNGGLKTKAPAEIIKHIVDSIQPYKGGYGHYIWALHALDIEDKHRLLIAKTHISYITGIRAQDDRDEEFDIPNWLIVEPFIATYHCVGHRNIKITNRGTPSYSVAFGSGMPMQGTMIPEVLRQFAESLSGTIDSIEKEFLARF